MKERTEMATPGFRRPSPGQLATDFILLLDRSVAVVLPVPRLGSPPHWLAVASARS